MGEALNIPLGKKPTIFQILPYDVVLARFLSVAGSLLVGLRRRLECAA